MEIRIPPEAVGLSVADADLTQLTRAVVPMPINERERVEALHRFEILDSSAEERFDELARLAALICNAPIAVISFLDRHRQWFKARVGIESRGTPREHAFCSYTILNPGEVMQVPDARLDPRFAANPMVSTEAGIRFYAGAPLLSSDGEAIGTLCVVDKEPRELRPDQLQALRSLAAQVVAQLELRLALREVERRRRALELAHDELAHDNLTDALTGVPNRRAFDDRLQREVARCGVDGLPVSVAMVDVDCFKQFNDAHGHVAGDGALRQVGRVLNNAIRGYDFVARYGGEEFAVILPGLDLKSARAVTDRLREAVESAVWEYRPVTISIGVATTSAPRALGKSAPAKLLDQADAALYEAKRGGRNRVVAFEVESGHAAACVHL